MGGEAGRCNTAAEPSQTWIKRPTKPVGIHQTLKLGRAYTVKPSPPSRSGQLVIPASNLREESLSIRRSESFPSVRLHLFQLSSGNTRAHEFRTSFSYLLRILKIRTIYSISFNFSRHNTNFTVSWDGFRKENFAKRILQLSEIQFSSTNFTNFTRDYRSWTRNANLGKLHPTSGYENFHPSVQWGKRKERERER